MKRTVQLTFALLLVLMLSACQHRETIITERIIAKPADKNRQSMSWVTGLHIHFLEESGFEFRVFEMDGSASVALNPIYLYLYVTDNVPGNSSQERMVSLPQASKIEKVRFFGNEPRIEIDVLLDRMDEVGMVTTQVPATFEVTVGITEGKLKGDIETLIKRPSTR